MASTAEALMVVAVALLVIYVSRMLFKKRNLNLPPGPTPWPIIGSLHLLGTHPHRSLTDLAKKYGPVMSLTLGQRYCIVASSPEAVKECLKLQDANFASRPPLRAAELILPKDLVLNDITPVSRHLRKIFVTELTSAKRLEASKFMRAEEIAYLLRSISKEPGPIRLNTYFNIMSTNILSRMILSKRFLGGGDNQSGDSPASSESVSEIKEFIEILNEVVYCCSAVHPQDFFNIPTWFDPQGLDKRFRKITARMDAFYKSMINQHKEDRRQNPVSGKEKNMLDVLLEQLEYPEHGVTEEHIQCLVWDALVGGTNTTMLTSEWTMAEVLRNPALIQKARSELDRVVGVDRTVQESDIPELKYIQAIVKEGFRLHAPLPLLVPHQNCNATKVFGYDIPAKTRLFVNIWATAHDPAIWEKPLEFMPERFLSGAPRATTEFQGQHFEFTPFGSGRRLCPGMSFASIAVHLQVASLLHAFDWSFPNGMAPEELDVTEGAGITVPMRDPLVAIARPRLAVHLY